MLNQNVLVVGSSGHAQTVIDILRYSQSLSLIGLVDDFRCVGDSAFGYPILGGMERLPELMKQCDASSIVVAVGDNWSRRTLVNRILDMVPHAVFPSVVHPHATISPTANIKEGCMIMANAVINSGGQLCPFCIVNTAATLDHGSVMEAFSSLAPGAHTGGNVTIGEGAAISIGASIIHGIKIGANSVIGAGAAVVDDIPEGVVAVGVPAKVLRHRTPEEPYL